MTEEKHMGYCVKCKDKREMNNPVEKLSKTNRLMLQGTCIVCQTKVNKFIKDSTKSSIKNNNKNKESNERKENKEK